MISIEDQEEIESFPTTRKKSDKIIDLLLSRGSKAYDYLCEAIMDLGVESFLVTKLNKLLADKMEQYQGKSWYILIKTDNSKDKITN